MSATQSIPENKQNDKETNFRLQEKALQDKYERQLQLERQGRLEAEKKLQDHQRVNQNDEDDDSEPYVDHKKLNKTLGRFEEKTMQKTQVEIQKAVQQAREEAKKEAWIENNTDFYDVLQHAENFANKAPGLARAILGMPEGFERQKLVYENIKQLGLHKPEVKVPSIQEKVDANRRGPYYQPSGISPAPYAGQQSDFSPQGQKAAHEKMQELKSRLRL